MDALINPTLMELIAIGFIIGYITFKLDYIISWLDKVTKYIIKRFTYKHDLIEDPIEKYNRMPVYIDGELFIDSVSLPEYQDGEWIVKDRINGMYTLINNTPHMIKNNQLVYPKINFIYDDKWNIIPESNKPIIQIPNVPYYIGYVYAMSYKYFLK